MTYKHTEGPWKVQGDTYVTINSLIIAHCKQDGHTSLDEAMANAHLIAAAPDLLAVLERARYGLYNYMTQRDKLVLISDIEAAISRARG